MRDLSLLVTAAARTVRCAAVGQEAPPADGDDPLLDERHGVFVTILRNGTLRGCVGFVEPSRSLREAVSEAALAAATRDARFEPVRETELQELAVEVSLLTPLRRVADVGRIEPGRHGVAVRGRARTGVYLPQVWEETGWDRERFLSCLCVEKASLPPDAWRAGGEAELYVFEVERAAGPVSAGR